MVARGSKRVVAEIGQNRPAWELFLVEGGDASDPSQVPPGALRALATSQPDNDGQRNSAGSHPASMWNGGANGNGTQWLTTKNNDKKSRTTRTLPRTTTRPKSGEFIWLLRELRIKFWFAICRIVLHLSCREAIIRVSQTSIQRAKTLQNMVHQHQSHHYQND